MDRADIVAFVLAGGQGSRLQPLTADHAKPAIEFTDGYRLVDFVLSSLFHSRIRRVYVVVQYKPDSLLGHLREVWQPRFRAIDGSLGVLLPESSRPEHQFQGTADAVMRHRELIARHDPSLVAVFAADHVYRMDLRQFARFHQARRAQVSICAARVPIREARSLGVIVADRNGRILRFEEKPQRPTALREDPRVALCSMGNYLFDPGALSDALDHAQATGGTDFGYHIMPRLPARGMTYAYDFSQNWVPGLQPWEMRGYWRDVGTLEAFQRAIDEASGPQALIELANPRWPILPDPRAARPHRAVRLKPPFRVRAWQPRASAAEHATAGRGDDRRA